MAMEGGGDRCPLVEEIAGDDEEQPFALSLLRSSCDGCWRKKCKCSGELPCSRCRRSGVQCNYSTKRRLGRPRGAAALAKLQLEQGEGASKMRKGGAGNSSSGGVGGAGTGSGDENDGSGMSFLSTPLSASRVTGLGGLAESRFLSTFLEHFTPM